MPHIKTSRLASEAVCRSDVSDHVRRSSAELIAGVIPHTRNFALPYAALNIAALSGYLPGLEGASALGLAIWGGIMVASTILLHLTHRRYTSNPETGPLGLDWRTVFSILFGFSGFAWGMLPWCTWAADNLAQHVYMALMCLSPVVVYCLRLGIDARVLYSATLPVVVLNAACHALSADPLSLFFAVMMPIWAMGTLALARKHGEALHEMLEARYKAQALALHLDEAQRQAEDRRIAAETANRTKSAFLANMSHELRTPLNAIIGFSEMMHQEMFGALTRRYQDYSKDILTSGQHLLQLVNDLLDVAKIEAGRMVLDVEEIDPEAVTQQVLRAIQPKVASKAQSLRFDAGPALGPLWADERAILQILLNLLSNAVKYTPDHGLIECRLRAEGHHIVWQIRDHGQGIPEEKLHQLFRPFERVDNSYSNASQGTGLGLALVKSLTEMHGGTVQLSSTEGEGTDVTVRIPRRSAGGVRHAA